MIERRYFHYIDCAEEQYSVSYEESNDGFVSIKTKKDILRFTSISSRDLDNICHALNFAFADGQKNIKKQIKEILK